MPPSDNKTHPANRRTDKYYDTKNDLAGDLHFDMAENWIFHPPSEEEKRQGKKYIFTTAVHELGHSLGFGHSEDTGSVMSRVMDPKWDNLETELSEVDINIILQKYKRPHNWFQQHWQVFALLGVCVFIIIVYKLLKPDKRNDLYDTPTTSEYDPSESDDIFVPNKEDAPILNVDPNEGDQQVRKIIGNIGEAPEVVTT